MKKIKWRALPIAAVALLAGCAGQKANQAPELRGVNDINCLVDSRVDLLGGVAALDAEDGDLTPALQITVTPAVDVADGYATFTKTGRYEVVYKIEDSAGLSAQTTAYVTVEEREVYMSNVHTNGFFTEAYGGARITADGICGSVYSFKFSGGEIAEDVRLSRSYTLVCGAEYAFSYHLNSSGAGIIKAAADGEAIAELAVNEGDNVLSFTHTLPARQSIDGEAPEDIANIELWLGGLEGETECSLSRVETQYTEQGEGYVRLVENLNFNGKIINRDDKAHAIGVNGDGTSAYVEITEPTGEMWQVGMFVNTGVALSAGNEYVLSFDVESEQDNPFEVCVQHEQWKDSDAVILSKPQGAVTLTVKADDNFNGTLWLFIRSGTHANKITVSNLGVKRKKGGIKSETFAVSPVTTNNYNGGAGSVKTEYGKIIYKAESFSGGGWGDNEIAGAPFRLTGAAGNFVISFRAKASQNLSCVFAASRAEAWDTFAWEKISITTEEQTFTIRCNEKNLEGLYKFIWQFGNAENAGLRDVTVEISDIKICNKSELDG
ncbi:MAG: DUF5011 domain-containing protein [Clostridia bacterium]|nr:DUF5011 domain-containing protein [Clostridia bacterium]